jgi:diguanylate cyclase (GGDEF)-like protein
MTYGQQEHSSGSTAVSLLTRFVRLGSNGVNPAIASRVRAVQLDAVRRYTPWMLVANQVNACVALAAFWDHALFAVVLAWFAVVTFLVAVIGCSWWQGRNEPARQFASIRGIQRSVIYAIMLGCIWGALPVMLYGVADGDQRIILIAVVSGMMGGGGITLATIAPASIAFAVSVSIGAGIATALMSWSMALMVGTLCGCYLVIIVRSTLSVSRTMTERIVAQIDSEEQNAVVGLLLNDFEANASDWLWSTDKDLLLNHVSARYCQLLGRREDELLGTSFLDSLPLLPASRCTSEESDILARLDAMFAARKPFRDFEAPMMLGETRLEWSLTAKPLVDSSGAFAGYRGVGRDVTTAGEARRKIERMARIDALTGLPNRLSMREDLAAALLRLDRRNEPFALLLLDLDHFKNINDTQGHPVGDALLVQVASRLTALAREHDTVARLGGDEFAIVLTMLETPKEAANFCESVIASIGKPFELETGSVSIGVSIGIAYAPVDGTDPDQLTRHADLALYRAKHEGRGGLRFFEPAMDAAARRRHRLERELRAAINEGTLQLHYQPQVNALTRRLTGFEALVRWDHPELGMLSPMEFIPLAEEVGLIQPLGAWVLTEACRQALTWPGHVMVAVNLSPVQFRSPQLFVQVQKILASTGLAPERLELEVTESLLLDSSGLVESTLKALKALGVKIALDDFGTGYSSLSYLRKYSFDRIKIDRSFVQDIESEPDSLAIVEAVIRLAKDLRMSLTVEGVETDAQLSSLQSRGCEEIQGYLIARPAPVSELSRFLNDPWCQAQGDSKNRR